MIHKNIILNLLNVVNVDGPSTLRFLFCDFGSNGWINKSTKPNICYPLQNVSSKRDSNKMNGEKLDSNLTWISYLKIFVFIFF